METIMTETLLPIEQPLCTPLFAGMNSEATTLAISPDETTLAVGYESGVIILWDTHQKCIIKKLKHKPRKILEDYYGAITALCFVSNKLLLMFNEKGRCWIINTETSERTLHAGIILPLHLMTTSPDGSRVLCIVKSLNIYNMDLATLDRFKITRNKTLNHAPLCAIYLDEHRVLTGDEEGKVTIIHLDEHGGPAQKQPQRYGIHVTDITAVAFAPETGLITGDNAGIIKCWKGPLHTDEKIAEPAAEFRTDCVKQLTLCQDGRTLIVSSKRALIFVDLVTGEKLLILRLFKKAVHSIRLFGNDRYMALNRRYFSTDQEQLGELCGPVILDFGAKNLGRDKHPLERRFATI